MVTVVNLNSVDTGWTEPEGSEELARSDALKPAERRELEALRRSIRSRLDSLAPTGVLSIDMPGIAALASSRGVTDAEIRRMRDLEAGGTGYAVYLEKPPGR